MRWFRLAAAVAVLAASGAIAFYLATYFLESALSESERHFGRGMDLHEEGRWEEAIEEFEQGIVADPDYDGNYIGLAALYLDLGEYEQARDVASRGIAEASDADDKGLAGLHNHRGFAYTELENLEQAMADLETAIQLEPDYAAAYNNRGLVYAELGDLERAIVDYDTCIELDPEAVQAYFNRASAYEELGRTDEALADFEKALSLTGDANRIAIIEAHIERLRGR